MNQMMKLSMSFSCHAQWLSWCFIQPNHLRKAVSTKLGLRAVGPSVWRTDVSLTTLVISFSMISPARASLATNPSCISVLEHVPQRHVGLRTIVGVGLFPIGCQLTPVVKIVWTEWFTEISRLEWKGVGHEWDVCLGRHLVAGTCLFWGSPIGERMGCLLSEHQCWPRLCDAEAVLFLLFHIKRTNTVLEGVESSLRQEELSDK